MSSELLEVSRTWQFVRLASTSDPQIKTLRGRMREALFNSLADVGDREVCEVSSDLYDKLFAFLNSTEAQAHYAGDRETVGIYAFSKGIMDLRRLCMAAMGVTRCGRDSPLQSPANSPEGPSPLAVLSSSFVSPDRTRVVRQRVPTDLPPPSGRKDTPVSVAGPSSGPRPTDPPTAKSLGFSK